LRILCWPRIHFQRESALPTGKASFVSGQILAKSVWKKAQETNCKDANIIIVILIIRILKLINYFNNLIKTFINGKNFTFSILTLQSELAIRHKMISTESFLFASSSLLRVTTICSWTTCQHRKVYYCELLYYCAVDCIRMGMKWSTYKDSVVFRLYGLILPKKLFDNIL